MNPKKKSRRCRASVSIQALDLAISRFIHSHDYITGLLYRPTVLQGGGPVPQPYARVDYISPSQTKRILTRL